MRRCMERVSFEWNVSSRAHHGEFISFRGDKNGVTREITVCVAPTGARRMFDRRCTI